MLLLRLASLAATLAFAGLSVAEELKLPSDALTTTDAAKTARAACGAGGDFNRCISKTVEYVYAGRRNKGYADSAFTKDLDYGPDLKAISASSPPKTMCVAAVSEVAIEALNFYYATTKDAGPFSVLKKDSWKNMSSTAIRSYMWENAGVAPRGAGAAFETFGIGERVALADLQPGDFLSFDRSRFRPKVTWTKEEIERKEKFTLKDIIKFEGQEGTWQTSGHSVVFIGYLNKNLDFTLSYEKKNIVGFLYFSSQGGAAPNGGFGFKWGVFKDAKSKDGKVICAAGQLTPPKDCGLGGLDRLSVRGGRLWHPSKWSKDKIASFVELVRAKTRTSIEAIVASDLRILKSYPTTPNSILSLPDARSRLSQAAETDEFEPIIEELVNAELEKENREFDFDHFNGVTE